MRLSLSIPAACSRLTRPASLLALVGVAVLTWWGSWWVGNFNRNKLQKSPPAWFPRFDYLGVDFLHNYRAARHWLTGGDPYREPFGDPLNRKLCYPPAVLPFFAWCYAVPERTAVVAWTVVLAGFAAAGTVAAWQTRKELGLTPVPLPFALAAILTCSPVAFAMERGNYDLLVLPLVIAAAWALRERSVSRDAVAGICLALAACLKIYPGLLIVALLPLRRGRAALVALVAAAGLATFQLHNLPIAIANLKELALIHNPAFWGGQPMPINHSLTCNWAPVWEDTKLAFLAKLPGPAAAAVVLGPLLLWIGYWTYHCPNPRQVVFPYLLWVAAAATFVPKVANDYSLFFLPLAALAVWDRRDPIPVHIGLAFLVLWAQPIGFWMSTSTLFGLKVIALIAAAAALVNRIREQNESDVHPLLGGP